MLGVVIGELVELGDSMWDILDGGWAQVEKSMYTGILTVAT